MVSRYDQEDSNIWDDINDTYPDERFNQVIHKPHKITSKKGSPAMMKKAIKEDIYQQVNRFIEAWPGNVYVIPGELYALYKKYCEENGEECLITSSKTFGRRLSHFTNNKKIKRDVLNNIPFYIKPSAATIVTAVDKPKKISGTKRKIREEDDYAEDSANRIGVIYGSSAVEDSAVEDSTQQPKKKRRLNGLATWSAQKEVEEFTLKISELEDQVKTLTRICCEQKEIITRLTDTQ